jgi:enamine deaminase RidA (YjgF/YER057c/UK114 family)
MSSSAARAASTVSAGGRIRRRRDVPGVPKPTGPFSWSVTCGGLVFLSGIRGIDPSTGRPDEGDGSRVRRIFQHLAALLEASGSSPRDVLSTRVYVTDMARHRPLVNAGFARFFGTELPARTIVEVRALNQGDTIELEVVAVRRPRPARPRRRAWSRVRRRLAR